jgi:hypothetical protein
MILNPKPGLKRGLKFTGLYAAFSLLVTVAPSLHREPILKSAYTDFKITGSITGRLLLPTKEKSAGCKLKVTVRLCPARDRLLQIVSDVSRRRQRSNQITEI